MKKLEKEGVVNKKVKKVDGKNKLSKDDKTKKGRNLFVVVSTIFFLIILGVVIGIVFLLLHYLNLNLGEEFNVNLDNNIESVILDQELNSVYLNLKIRNETNITSLKFAFLDENGVEYYYTTDEVNFENISFPYKQEFYNYKINLSSVGISFQNIINISVIFIYENVTVVNQTSNDTIPPVYVPPIINWGDSGDGDSDSDDDDDDDDDDDCELGSWEDYGEYKCEGSLRKQKQTRDGCPSGTDERWVEENCASGYVCYENFGAPDNKCVNINSTCNDFDNGKNYEINSSVNLTILDLNYFFEDFCDGNLTEYYCYYNSSSELFQVENESIDCQFGCSNDSCIVCEDNDNDGYNITGGLCGEFDCNDSNSAINPGAEEIFGDDVDEDCNGIIEKGTDRCSNLTDEIKIKIDELKNHSASLVLQEGEPLSQGDYFVLSQNDDHYLMNMTKIYLDEYGSDIYFEDVLTHTQYDNLIKDNLEINQTIGTNVSININSESFVVSAVSSNQVAFTWEPDDEIYTFDCSYYVEVDRCSDLSNNTKNNISILINSGENVILRENREIVLGDYFVLQNNNKEYIMKMNRVLLDWQYGSDVYFEDVLTSTPYDSLIKDNLEINETLGTSVDIVIDGEVYTVTSTGSGVKFSWDPDNEIYTFDCDYTGGLGSLSLIERIVGWFKGLF